MHWQAVHTSDSVGDTPAECHRNQFSGGHFDDVTIDDEIT
jgi:hypothetical protein